MDRCKWPVGLLDMWNVGVKEEVIISPSKLCLLAMNSVDILCSSLSLNSCYCEGGFKESNPFHDQDEVSSHVSCALIFLACIATMEYNCFSFAYAFDTCSGGFGGENNVDIVFVWMLVI